MPRQKRKQEQAQEVPQPEPQIKDEKLAEIARAIEEVLNSREVLDMLQNLMDSRPIHLTVDRKRKRKP